MNETINVDVMRPKAEIWKTLETQEHLNGS